MKQRETVFKEKVLSRLTRLKPKLWFVKIQMVATRGIPDILMCAGGKFVAWELKVGSNKADSLQQFILNKIELAQGVARVVTPENFDEAFEELACLCSVKSEKSPSKSTSDKPSPEMKWRPNLLPSTYRKKE